MQCSALDWMLEQRKYLCGKTGGAGTKAGVELIVYRCWFRRYDDCAAGI